MQHSTEPRDGNMSELSRNHLLIEPTSSEHPGSKNMKKLKVLRRVWNSWNIWTFRRVWTFRGPEPSEGLSLQRVWAFNMSLHTTLQAALNTHIHTHTTVLTGLSDQHTEDKEEEKKKKKWEEEASVEEEKDEEEEVNLQLLPPPPPPHCVWGYCVPWNPPAGCTVHACP